MKHRVLVLVFSILYYSAAFSQHPYSRGGKSPFYWAIVGGIAAALWYVVSLILGNYKSILSYLQGIKRRIKSSRKQVKTKQEVSALDSSERNDESQIITHSENGADVSSEIDNSFSQSFDKEIIEQVNEKAEPYSISNNNVVSRSPDQNGKSKKKVFTKRKRIFWILLLICSILASIIGYVLYDNQKKANEQRENARTIKTEPNKVINREFLVFKFKDSKSDVINTLKNRNLICKSSSCDSVINVCDVVYANVRYGDKKIDTLRLSFYKDRLFAVRMIFNITYQDQQNKWTFNRFETLFKKKRYQIDFGAERHNNMRTYSDPYTRLKLWHSFVGPYSSETPSVWLMYYDKSSGYEEAMNRGF